jgi:hypothetical protein
MGLLAHSPQEARVLRVRPGERAESVVTPFRYIWEDCCPSKIAGTFLPSRLRSANPGGAAAGNRRDLTEAQRGSDAIMKVPSSPAAVLLFFPLLAAASAAASAGVVIGEAARDPVSKRPVRVDTRGFVAARSSRSSSRASPFFPPRSARRPSPPARADAASSLFPAPPTSWSTSRPPRPRSSRPSRPSP